MEATNKLSYYAVIPGSILQDDRLRPSAKILYGYISSLCNQKGFCWAGDKYLAELNKASERTVQEWLKQLEDYGYIARKVIYKEGTKEIEKRLIYLKDPIMAATPPTAENRVTPTAENRVTPTAENRVDNIKGFNNKDMSGKPDEASNQKEKIPYKKIIEELNSRTGKNFKNVETNQKLIRARWNEGNREEDFYKVIDWKVQNWLNDAKMKDYLRPTTLFGNKFDTYLNEVPTPKGPNPNGPGSKFKSVSEIMEEI